VTVAGVDVPGMVHTQRKHALAALQDYTRVKVRLTEAELAASLVVEAMIFQCEAEIRWLDHVEARVLRHTRAHRAESAGDRGTRQSPEKDDSKTVAPQTGR
jgi:hypothetical protein